MRSIFRSFCLCIVLFVSGENISGQAHLEYQYRQYARQDTSFYTSVAFAQTKHSRLVDMGNNIIAIWGCNKALSHLQIQYLTKKPRLERIELPGFLKEYYQTNGLTFGNVAIHQDSAFLVLNESFVLTLIRDKKGAYHIKHVYDAFPVLHHPIKKIHVYDGKFHVIVSEPRESTNDNSDLFVLNLFRLDTKRDETTLLWQKEFLKRFTRNIYFENYFFRDSNFHYFNPLTYEVECVNQKNPRDHKYIQFADKGDFKESHEKMLILKEFGDNESNIQQFINITQEDLVKDYIKLIYPCKEGYLIWKTNYPQKKSYSLDWVSKDLKHIHRNIAHPFSYTARDSSEIGSLDNFPITPSGNYIQILNNSVIVGVHHSGVNYSSSTKHCAIWQEYYKTVGRDFDGQYIMDYYFFDYILQQSN